MLIIRRIKSCQYIIWYISFCVGSCLVCRSFRTGVSSSHLHSMINTRWCIDKIWFSWWWALGCSKNVEKGNEQIHWKKCVKLVINKNYTEMHGQRNIKFYYAVSENVGVMLLFLSWCNPLFAKFLEQLRVRVTFNTGNKCCKVFSCFLFNFWFWGK